MANDLMLIIEGHRTFDRGEIKQILLHTPGVFNLREDPLMVSALQAEFDCGEDRTVVDLGKKGRYISMSDVGQASLQLALEIQKGLELPLRAFDTAYSFDVHLEGIETLAELTKTIEQKMALEGMLAEV
jgi:Arc/MetJ-type ribon-helix-helix transcriptional regulator